MLHETMRHIMNGTRLYEGVQPQQIMSLAKALLRVFDAYRREKASFSAEPPNPFQHIAAILAIDPTAGANRTEVVQEYASIDSVEDVERVVQPGQYAPWILSQAKKAAKAKKTLDWIRDETQGNPERLRELQPQQDAARRVYDAQRWLIDPNQWSVAVPAPLSDTEKTYETLRSSLADYSEMQSRLGLPQIEQYRTIRDFLDIAAPQLTEATLESIPPLPQFDSELLRTLGHPELTSDNTTVVMPDKETLAGYADGYMDKFLPENISEEQYEELRVLASAPRYVAVRIVNSDDACGGKNEGEPKLHGTGTGWCTSHKSTASKYLQRGVLYVVYANAEAQFPPGWNTTGQLVPEQLGLRRVAQVFWEVGASDPIPDEIMDSDDDPISESTRLRTAFEAFLHALYDDQQDFIDSYEYDEVVLSGEQREFVDEYYGSEVLGRLDPADDFTLKLIHLNGIGIINDVNKEYMYEYGSEAIGKRDDDSGTLTVRLAQATPRDLEMLKKAHEFKAAYPDEDDFEDWGEIYDRYELRGFSNVFKEEYDDIAARMLEHLVEEGKRWDPDDLPEGFPQDLVQFPVVYAYYKNNLLHFAFEMQNDGLTFFPSENLVELADEIDYDDYTLEYS